CSKFVLWSKTPMPTGAIPSRSSAHSEETLNSVGTRSASAIARSIKNCLLLSPPFFRRMDAIRRFPRQSAPGLKSETISNCLQENHTLKNWTNALELGNLLCYENTLPNHRGVGGSCSPRCRVSYSQLCSTR